MVDTIIIIITLLADLNQQGNDFCNFPYILWFDRHLHLSSQALVSVRLNTSVCHVEHKCLSFNLQTSNNQYINQCKKKEQAYELISPTGNYSFFNILAGLRCITL